MAASARYQTAEPKRRSPKLVAERVAISLTQDSLPVTIAEYNNFLREAMWRITPRLFHIHQAETHTSVS